MLKATGAKKKQWRVERNLPTPPPAASKTAAQQEAGFPHEEELEEVEESLPARAEAHWDVVSTNGEQSEEEL